MDKEKLSSIVISTWTACLVSLLFATPLLVYILFTSYYPITIAYCLWLAWDWKSPVTGGWRHTPLADWCVFRDIIPNYFPVRMVSCTKTPLTADRNYVLGVHPHGAAPMAFLAGRKAGNYLEQCGLKVFGTTVSVIMRVPLAREFLLSVGVVSVSNASLDHVLGGAMGVGNAVGIFVGGVKEMLLFQPYTMKVVLKNRFGFVKSAIRNGASLVPCITFGTNEMYHKLAFPEDSLLFRLQRRLMDTGIPVVGFYSKSWVPMSPMRVPITFFVGEPIHLARVVSPSEEYVEHVHAKYCKALEELYHANKAECGYADVPFQIL